MNFKCKSCGASMVFSPKDQAMLCPFCSQLNRMERVGNDSLTECPSCGAELDPGKYISASKCPFCDNNIIFDVRVSGEYKPDTILPFKLDKSDVVEAIDKEFKHRTFAPASFLHEKTLKDITGNYVPFFLYDYSADAEYSGRGIRIRTWNSGNYQYTEKSYYDVIRKMHADYDNIPADASDYMPDYIMDNIEPYNYKQLTDFDPKYLSGFLSEVYNNGEEAYEERAHKKASDNVDALMKASLSNYVSLTPTVDTANVEKKKVDYALLPVWIYEYKWRNQKYPIFVNGQTGKVVGITPISKRKLLIYALTAGAFVFAALEMLIRIF